MPEENIGLKPSSVDVSSRLTPYELILGTRSFGLIRLLVVLAGTVLFIGGAFLVNSGLSGGGVIDLKAAVIQGRLETGSVGVLFSFMAFVLLFASLFSQKGSKLQIKSLGAGKLDIIYKGGLTKEKSASIERLILAGLNREKGNEKTS